MEKEPKYTRPENLLESLGGVDFKRLDEEERTMQKLLVEKYKKSHKNLLTEVQKWREDHPEATLGDSIRALYTEIEEEA